MSEHDEMAEAVRADILRAFGLQPWQIGLAPVPRRIRIWRKVSFWRLRAVRRYRRKAHGEPTVLEDW